MTENGADIFFHKITKKLPVALWIHGGGYREGFGSEPEFDGQEWGAKDVVLPLQEDNSDFLQ